MELRNRFLGGRLAIGEAAATSQNRRQKYHESNVERFQMFPFLANFYHCGLLNED